MTPRLVVGYFMFSRALLVVGLCAGFSGGALAEFVYVKYLAPFLPILSSVPSLTATGLHAALSDGSAFRPVAQTAQPGIQQLETLVAAG